MLKTLLAGVAAIAFLTASPAMATEFVSNGTFSATSATSSRQMSASDGTQFVTGWTNGNSGGSNPYQGYSFIVMGDDGTKVNGIQSNSAGPLYMWSKYSDAADAKSNGYTSSASIKGSGGNYIAADGDYQKTLFYQQINNLTVGAQYDLTFNWAGAQQHGFNGATSEGWNVYFGTSSNYASYTTGLTDNVEHGFTGWKTAATTFTATGTSQILAFLAQGTPQGQPPFSLLDDVSLTEHVAAVPEPATWAMFIGGFGLIGGTLRRRRPALATA